MLWCIYLSLFFTFGTLQSSLTNKPKQRMNGVRCETCFNSFVLNYNGCASNIDITRYNQQFLVVFLLRKTTLCCHSRCLSVRPSVVPSVCPSVRLSVRPSSVKISLERGCTITNRPIDLQFGLSIGGGVMHV